MAHPPKVTQVDVQASAQRSGALPRAPSSGGFLSGRSSVEIRSFSRVLEDALQVRTHRALLDWLQGGLQAFLPHDILLAAWGDFALGLVYYDVISPLPGIRTDLLDEQQVNPLLQGFFENWQGCDRVPYTMHVAADLLRLVAADTPNQTHRALTGAKTVLVHGIKDERGRHDCLYVLFGGAALGTRNSGDALAILLPYLDASLRQVSHLPVQYPPATLVAETAAEDGSDGENFGLSPRELEILNWVGKGKTNYEIGVILDISAFTVKNHLQRIFRKLNVLNRAQAVSRLRAGNLPHQAGIVDST